MPSLSPVSGTNCRDITVRELVGAVPKGVGALVDALRGEVRVRGEIIAVRHGNDFAEVTLLDPETGAAAINARVPASAAIPDVGRVAGILGEITAECDDLGVKVYLKGRVFDSHHSPGERSSKARARFEELSRQLAGVRITHVPTDRIRRVGLVTGRGRAEADLRATLNPSSLMEKRVPAIDVKVFHVRMRDPSDIAAGISTAVADPTIDLIVVARGGGAPIDLHQFNTLEVLNAMAHAVTKKFVLTAIGHAEDKTLADRLASHSEPAPVAAGAWVRKAEFKIWQSNRAADLEAEKAAADTESVQYFDDVAMEAQSAPSAQRRLRPWRDRPPRHTSRSPARRWAGRLFFLALGGYAGWAASGVLRGDGRSGAGAATQHRLEPREPQPPNPTAGTARRAVRKAKIDKDAPAGSRASQGTTG